MEHQKDTGDGEDDEEKAGDSSEAEGIGESKTMAFHLGWEDMEKEVVIDKHGSFQIGVRYSSSENGFPNCRIQDALEEPLFHFTPFTVIPLFPPAYRQAGFPKGGIICPLPLLKGGWEGLVFPVEP